MTDYTRKLAAWLHDPADKQLVLLRDPAGHEGGTARALRGALAIPSQSFDHRADWLAAAADRPNWPRGTDAARYPKFEAVRFTKEPELIHPLSGERLSLSAGLRADAVSTRNRGGYFGDRSSSDGTLSGYAALTFSFAREWKATAQWAHGFRVPTLSDLYFRGVSGRGFVVGNPDLLPETSSQWDLSVRGRSGPIGLGLSGYVYRIEDLIERYRAGDDYQFRNRGEAEIAGVELDAEVRLAPRLVVHLSGSLSQGRILDDGTWAPDILPPTAQLVVDHEPVEGLFWRARLLASARDDRPGASEVVVAGYARLDLSAGCRVSDLLTVTLSARNVLDAAYADSADALHVTAPGRGAVLTLSGSF